jgi:hypothetical protein
MAQFAAMRDLEIWYAHVTAEDQLNMMQQSRKRVQTQVATIRQRDSLQALSKLPEVVVSVSVMPRVRASSIPRSGRGRGARPILLHGVTHSTAAPQEHGERGAR